MEWTAISVIQYQLSNTLVACFPPAISRSCPMERLSYRQRIWLPFRVISKFSVSHLQRCGRNKDQKEQIFFCRQNNPTTKQTQPRTGRVCAEPAIYQGPSSPRPAGKAHQSAKSKKPNGDAQATVGSIAGVATQLTKCLHAHLQIYAAVRCLPHARSFHHQVQVTNT